MNTERTGKQIIAELEALKELFTAHNESFEGVSLMEATKLNNELREVLENFINRRTYNVITTNYKFKVDTEESDENAAVKMYDQSGKLISDNFHGANFLYSVLSGEEEEEEITFISPDMEYNRIEILKERAANQE